MLERRTRKKRERKLQRCAREKHEAEEALHCLEIMLKQCPPHTPTSPSPSNDHWDLTDDVPLLPRPPSWRSSPPAWESTASVADPEQIPPPHHCDSRCRWRWQSPSTFACPVQPSEQPCFQGASRPPWPTPEQRRRAACTGSREIPFCQQGKCQTRHLNMATAPPRPQTS